MHINLSHDKIGAKLSLRANAIEPRHAIGDAVATAHLMIDISVTKTRQRKEHSSRLSVLTQRNVLLWIHMIDLLASPSLFHGKHCTLQTRRYRPHLNTSECIEYESQSLVVVYPLLSRFNGTYKVIKHLLSYGCTIRHRPRLRTTWSKCICTPTTIYISNSDVNLLTFNMPHSATGMKLRILALHGKWFHCCIL